MKFSKLLGGMGFSTIISSLLIWGVVNFSNDESGANYYLKKEGDKINLYMIDERTRAEVIVLSEQIVILPSRYDNNVLISTYDEQNSRGLYLFNLDTPLIEPILVTENGTANFLKDGTILTTDSGGVFKGSYDDYLRGTQVKTGNLPQDSVIVQDISYDNRYILFSGENYNRTLYDLVTGTNLNLSETRLLNVTFQIVNSTDGSIEVTYTNFIGLGNAPLVHARLDILTGELTTINTYDNLRILTVDNKGLAYGLYETPNQNPSLFALSFGSSLEIIREYGLPDLWDEYTISRGFNYNGETLLMFNGEYFRLNADGNNFEHLSEAPLGLIQPPLISDERPRVDIIEAPVESTPNQ